MAKQTVTGDKELTRLLNALERKTARKLHRTAARNGAKVVAAKAKAIVPRKTGRFAKAMTVRAVKRSRSRMGYQVVQRDKYARSKSGRNMYPYGTALELGWTAGGRVRGAYSFENSPLDAIIKRAKRSPRKTNLQATTVEGRWAVRRAGIIAEPTVVALYRRELAALIEAEA